MPNNKYYTAEFKKRIYELCRIHDVSVGRLAQRAGVPRNVLYNAVNNNCVVGIKNLIKLSETYSVSVDWLLGR